MPVKGLREILEKRRGANASTDPAVEPDATRKSTPVPRAPAAGNKPPRRAAGRGR